MESETNNFHTVNLSKEDALSFTSGMYKVGDLVKSVSSLFFSVIASTLHENLRSKGIDINSGTYIANAKTANHAKWFREGIDCEILQPNSPGWKKGKIRLKVVLEFHPDEPESPLDDVRQEIQKNT